MILVQEGRFLSITKLERRRGKIREPRNHIRCLVHSQPIRCQCNSHSSCPLQILVNNTRLQRQVPASHTKWLSRVQHYRAQYLLVNRTKCSPASLSKCHLQDNRMPLQKALVLVILIKHSNLQIYLTRHQVLINLTPIPCQPQIQAKLIRHHL